MGRRLHEQRFQNEMEIIRAQLAAAGKVTAVAKPAPATSAGTAATEAATEPACEHGLSMPMAGVAAALVSIPGAVIAAKHTRLPVCSPRDIVR